MPELKLRFCERSARSLFPFSQRNDNARERGETYLKAKKRKMLFGTSNRARSGRPLNSAKTRWGGEVSSLTV